MIPTSLIMFFNVVCNAHGFIRHHQSFLPVRVVRGYAGGAGVFIALQRLDTAQCKHVASGRGYEVRTHTQRPCHG